MRMIDGNALPSWVFLVGGIIFFLSALNGIKKVSASVFVSPGFNRKENPVQFWMAIIMLILGGACGLYVFVSDLFH